MPPRRPVLRLAIMQPDQPRRNEAVDPRAGVRVQVDDEVVRGAGRGREQDDNGHEPVEEELHIPEMSDMQDGFGGKGDVQQQQAN